MSRKFVFVCDRGGIVVLYERHDGWALCGVQLGAYPSCRSYSTTWNTA